MSSNDKFFNAEMEALAQKLKGEIKSTTHAKLLEKLYLAVKSHFSDVFNVMLAGLNASGLRVYDFEPPVIMQSSGGKPVLHEYAPIANVEVNVEEIGKVSIILLKTGTVKVYKIGGGSAWNGMPIIELLISDDTRDAGARIAEAVKCLRQCVAIVHNVADEDEKRVQISNALALLTGSTRESSLPQ